MKKLLLIVLVFIGINAHSQNVGIGTTTPQSKLSVGQTSQFQIDSIGNIKKINNIACSFPSSQGSNGQLLGNNGSGTLSWISLPSSYVTLNGLTGTSQTFATGFSGSDFNISSSGTTHTFNIPNASAINRGLITTTDWNTFNNKLNRTGTDTMSGTLVVTNPITIATPTANTHAATKQYVDNATSSVSTSVNNKLNRTGADTMSGTLVVTNPITIATPTASAHAATKLYVDNATSSQVSTSRTVSTTAPLTGGGALTSNLTIALPQSNNSTSGYVSSADWNTFNNKLNRAGTDTMSGTLVVTNPITIATPTASAHAATKLYVDNATSSVSTSVNNKINRAGTDTMSGTLVVTNPITIATPTANAHAATKLYVDNATSGQVTTSRTVSTTAPLTGGGALSSNLTIALPQANTSTSGYISSTDWTAHNNKINRAGTDTMSGTLVVTNPITVATPTANTHAATKLYVDNATSSVSTSVNNKLNRTGTDTMSGTLLVNNFKTNNLVAGAVTYPNTTGTSGYYLQTNGAGTASWAAVSSGVPYTGATGAVNLGAYDLTVNEQTVGKGGGSVATNTAIGKLALPNNTTGNHNTATGTEALRTNSSGSGNTAYGYQALNFTTLGDNNTATGVDALFYNTTGTSNTSIGYATMATNITGSNNTAIGTGADVASGALTNATAIGNGAVVAASNTIQLGNTSVTNVKTSGTLTAGAVTYPNTTGTSGYYLQTNGAGTASWAAVSGGGSGVPYTGATGAVNLGAYDLTVHGITVGMGAGSVSTNTASGLQALNANTTGSSNTAIGQQALYANTTGSWNTATGALSLPINSTGLGVAAYGVMSLYNNTTGSYNTANGNLSLRYNTTGSYNTASGHEALSINTTGSNNTAIGYLADVASGALTNATAIGNGAVVAASNTIQLGNTSVTNVKTSGTITAGAVTYPNTTGTSGYYLQTNGAGVASWAAVSGGGSGVPYTGATAAVNLGAYDLTVHGITVGMGAGSVSTNTATGFQTLNANTTGSQNTATGYRSLFSNTTGNYNTANGSNSLVNNTIGGENDAFGVNSLNTNTTGSQNTAYGNGALTSNTTGSYNTAIGYIANVASGALTNATAIGNGAIVAASNTIQLGNTSVTNVKTSGTLTAGAVTYPNTTGTSGYYLQTNGAGTASWAAVSGSGVPYTGATGAVNLGAYDLTVHGITVGMGAGSVASNTANGLLALGSNTSGWQNTANGYHALWSNTTSYNCTAFGYQTLRDNTTGIENNACGSEALHSNTTGSGNTGNGALSLMASTIGSENTATGHKSQYGSTTGSFNTSDGGYSLFTNTTGSNNTAIGYFADVATGALTNATAIGNGAIVAASNTIQLGNTSVTNVKTSGTLTAGAVTYPNTTGTNGYYLQTNGAGTASWAAVSGFVPYTGATGAVNLGAYDLTVHGITVGMGAGSVATNNATGYQALYSNTTGSNNNATGYQALYSNTTGYANTATGFQALLSNTTGSNNTATGYNCLYSNTTGFYNNATGIQALLSNTTGSNNNATGYQALYSNTTGYANNANGNAALLYNTTGSYNNANGNDALYSNTTGSNNNATGYQALYSNTTGTNNTAIGYGANVASGALTNATAIGNGAVVAASNTVRIGNTSVTSIGGQVGWTTLSDGRMKENVKEEVPGLSFILSLRPVTYNLNTKKYDAMMMQQMPDSIKAKRMQTDEAYNTSSSILHTGFIAQEVEAAAKKVGFNFDGVDAPKNENDLYGIRYAEFVVPLVKAVQEQQVTINAQQTTINAQQKQIDELKLMVEALMKK